MGFFTEIPLQGWIMQAVSLILVIGGAWYKLRKQAADVKAITANTGRVYRVENREDRAQFVEVFNSILDRMEADLTHQKAEIGRQEAEIKQLREQINSLNDLLLQKEEENMRLRIKLEECHNQVKVYRDDKSKTR